MITLKSIRTVSSSPSYTRGNQLYKQRKVLDFEKTEDGEMLYLSANVMGSTGNQYHVQLQYHKETEAFKNYVCECEAWQTYSGMCKHCVAVALEEFYFDTAPRQISMMPTIKAKETDQALTNIIYASSMREKARISCSFWSSTFCMNRRFCRFITGVFPMAITAITTIPAPPMR